MEIMAVRAVSIILTDMADSPVGSPVQAIVDNPVQAMVVEIMSKVGNTIMGRIIGATVRAEMADSLVLAIADNPVLAIADSPAPAMVVEIMSKVEKAIMGKVIATTATGMVAMAAMAMVGMVVVVTTMAQVSGAHKPWLPM